ncbi:MAG: FAD-binding protein [Armatimonadota bacterium]|nr:FAD-binding protein [Armatimonadota bacterium]
MAEVLLVAFEKSDCDSLVIFAGELGKSFELICLSENGVVPPADVLARSLADKSTDYSIVAFPATMAGKDAAPRVAALLDRPMVSDVMGVEPDNAFLRPMFAGNVTAKVQVDADRFVVSVRATAFQGTADASPVAFLLPAEGATKRTSVDEARGGRPDLAQARVVVSGGRPLKDSETFEKLIGGLADQLGGAAGATRAAVDSGIAANELQVGQTGKIVAPELYIAAGISGSTQHMAGMKDSKVIVAINTDGDAPIFDIADFGLVMDLYRAIPELMEKLK